jgi:hypothetical protein
MLLMLAGLLAVLLMLAGLLAVLAILLVLLVAVLVVVGAVLVVVVVVLVLVVVVFAVLVVFVLSAVVQPDHNAATASRLRRAKVLRIEFSPVTQRVNVFWNFAGHLYHKPGRCTTHY